MNFTTSRRRIAAITLALLGTGLNASTARAQTQPYIGQVMCGAFSYAPKGWAMLDGQLMSIGSNVALFSLLGTTYGGNGQTTFALPDMRGRLLMHAGSGPGLTPHAAGDKGGAESASLSLAQLPPHAHQVGLSAQLAELKAPKPGAPGADVAVYKGSTPTTPTGSGTPLATLSPYLTLNCMIAVVGAWPERP
jgi:microcystin-dependent protein